MTNNPFNTLPRSAVLPQGLSTGSSPTFAGATFSGLTASRLVQTNGSKALASVADLTTFIGGTANQITVAQNGGGVTLAAAQDISTTSAPTFQGLSVTGALGTEGLTNGGFTSALTGWTGANWAWSAGTALHTAGATTALSPNPAATVTAGTLYHLSFDIVGGSAGTVTPSCGGNTFAAHSFGTVTSIVYCFYAVATTNLAFTPASAFDGAIDNVSLKAISQAVTFTDNYLTSPNDQPLMFKKTLSHATKEQVAFHFAYQTNKATSGTDTGILLQMLDTASPGTSYGLDYRVGGSSKFAVNNAGTIYAAGLNGLSSALPISIEGGYSHSSTSFTAVNLGYSTWTQTSGSNVNVKIAPTYNQASGTAANTDLQILRTETALGSGVQKFFDMSTAALGTRGWFGNDGRQYQSVPNSAVTDGNLFAGSMSCYLNEAGNVLTFRVLYTNGSTYKTGTIALT